MPKTDTPAPQQLHTLLGDSAYDMWRHLSGFATQSYAANAVWHLGGKAGVYELKFQKGGKTIFSLFASAQHMRLMVILGAAERAVFEQNREHFSPFIQAVYDTSKTYHDGKWMMFDVPDQATVNALKDLILIKKKPLSAAR